MTNRRTAVQARHKRVPFAHFLPYWDVLDDVVVLVDGSLGAGFRLVPRVAEILDDEQKDWISSRLENVLTTLPDGVCFQVMLTRHGNFDDSLREHLGFLNGASAGAISRLAHLLTEDRVRQYRAWAKEGLLKRTSCYFFVLLPAKRDDVPGYLRKIVMALKPPKTFVQRRKEEHQRLVRELNRICSTLQEALSAVGLHPVRLTDADNLELLYRTLNPARAFTLGCPRVEVGRRSPSGGRSLREQLVYADYAIDPDRTGFVLDGLHHRIVSLKVQPEATFPAMGALLARGAHDLDVIVTGYTPNKAGELTALKARKRITSGLRLQHVMMGRADVDVESDVQDQQLDQTIRDLVETSRRLVHAEIFLLIRGPDRDATRETADHVLLSLRSLNGAEGLLEHHATTLAFLESLPYATRRVPYGKGGVHVDGVRPQRFRSDNLADLLPIWGEWEGHASPAVLFGARRGGLVKFDPFNPAQPAWNSAVVGTTGGGKSFLVNYLVGQYLSQNPMIFIVDVGGSYRKLCGLLEGQYVEFSLDDPVTINPFRLTEGRTEPARTQVAFLTALISRMLAEEGEERIPRRERAVVEEAIRTLYSQRKAGQELTLSDYVQVLRSEDAESVSIARRLGQWVGEGSYGRFFDGPNRFRPRTGAVVFDLKGLSDYPDLQSTMLLTIINFIWQNVEHVQDRKKLVVFDEVWSLLKNPAAGRFVEESFRTFRKHGAAAIAITQDIRDFSEAQVGRSILSNAPNKFLLAHKGDTRPLRQALNLADVTMGLVESLTQRRGEYSEVYFISGQGEGVVQVRPTKLEYVAYNTDPGFLATWEDTVRLCGSVEKALKHLAGQDEGGPGEKGVA